MWAYEYKNFISHRINNSLHNSQNKSVYDAISLFKSDNYYSVKMLLQQNHPKLFSSKKHNNMIESSREYSLTDVLFANIISKFSSSSVKCAGFGTNHIYILKSNIFNNNIDNTRKLLTFSNASNQSMTLNK